MGSVASFRFHLASCAIGGVRSPSRRAVEPFEVEAGKTHTFDLQLPAK
jgi:hypothetical protein